MRNLSKACIMPFPNAAPDAADGYQESPDRAGAGRRAFGAGKRALIDTGCDGLAVSPRVVQQLAITPTDTIKRHTAGGTVFVGVYDISLQLLSTSGVFLDLADLRGVPAIDCRRASI